MYTLCNVFIWYLYTMGSWGIFYFKCNTFTEILVKRRHIFYYGSCPNSRHADSSLSLHPSPLPACDVDDFELNYYFQIFPTIANLFVNGLNIHVYIC